MDVVVAKRGSNMVMELNMIGGVRTCTGLGLIIEIAKIEVALEINC